MWQDKDNNNKDNVKKVNNIEDHDNKERIQKQKQQRHQ